MRNLLLIGIVIIRMLSACSEKGNEPLNPYNQKDNNVYVGIDGADTTPDPESIAGLHKNIFKPTCANSGCHDGNFEPDFRSITSTYNTLVNQPVIKNDELNPFTSRVTPGNATTSMILKRLTEDLNNNSGIMPLVTEPGSDWKLKKDEYINNIKKWIENGALDMNGKGPEAVNFPVQLQGMQLYQNGNLVNRQSHYNFMEINSGAGTVEVWISFADDKTPVGNLTGLKASFSKMANVYDSLKEYNIEYVSTPKSALGFYKEMVDYHHKITIDTRQIAMAGDVLWIRTKIGDGVSAPSQLPNDNSLFSAKRYCAIKLQ